jgi:hypothetical protein
MMAKGTYAGINLATADLDAPFARLQAGGAEVVQEPTADRHDLNRVHGARVNNLKDLSIEIPKRRLTVFTGVSGSGKSALVFGTIAAESQRLINRCSRTSGHSWTGRSPLPLAATAAAPGLARRLAPRGSAESTSPMRARCRSAT